MPDVKINKSVSEQLKKRLENDEKFYKKLDGIANGQVTIFIKHCRINFAKYLEDEIWEEKKN